MREWSYRPGRFGKRLGGPQTRSGHSGKRRNLTLSQEYDPGLPVSSLVTVLTELQQGVFEYVFVFSGPPHVRDHHSLSAHLGPIFNISC